MASKRVTKSDPMIPGNLYRCQGQGDKVLLCTKPMCAVYGASDGVSFKNHPRDFCLISVEDGGLWSNEGSNPKRDRVYIDITQQKITQHRAKYVERVMEVEDD